MSNKDFKAQMGKTLKNLDKDIRNRFEKAEENLGVSTTTKEEKTLSDSPITTVEETRETVNGKSSNTGNAGGPGKTIRDNYTIPEQDYRIIDDLKHRMAVLGVLLNKSEILRLGLHSLNDASDEKLIALAKNLVRIKPAKSIG